ncbi:hypothetical protein [Corynebacterium yudongzhengii]|uniref:hypothetical protein n=1 Tax=Corynebacterium yudongzhengii TaxID=2080740 RepID=UPI001304D702|nr:hypothetical protein [Corynebacterium yudongzhengii]
MFSKLDRMAAADADDQQVMFLGSEFCRAGAQVAQVGLASGAFQTRSFRALC